VHIFARDDLCPFEQRVNGGISRTRMDTRSAWQRKEQTLVFRYFVCRGKGRCSSEAAAITTNICCGNARPFRVPKRRERPLGTGEHRQLGPAETRAPVRMNRFRGDVIPLRNKKKKKKNEEEESPACASPRFRLP